MYVTIVRPICLLGCLCLALAAPLGFAQQYNNGDFPTALSGLQPQTDAIEPVRRIDPWASVDATTGLVFPPIPLQRPHQTQQIEVDNTDLASPYLHLDMGLLGGQRLAVSEGGRLPGGFSLNGMVAVRPPVNEFTDDTRINPGQNRWEVRVGLPVVQQWGAAGNMTTLKLAPGVSFYSDNDDPFGADKLEQAPLLQFEAHLTRDLLRGFLSLGVDFNYVRGGKTQIDGIDQDNRQTYRTVGVNASGRLSREIGWSLEYSRSESDQQELDDADWYRLKLNYSF
jgi:hypothetical protein